MATQTTTQTEAAAKAAKEKNVLDDMDSRRIIANPEEAIAYLGACIENYPDFGKYPIAAAGVTMDDEGGLSFDPEYYNDDSNVMVAVLTQRGDGPGTSTVKAIVIAPVPTLDSIMGSDEGKAWATGILHKELNHVAVRQLRKADNVADVVDSMPKTLADYITSNRESGGMLQAFEDLWRPIKNNMGKLSRSWRLANLSKKELRRGMESAAYASEYYPTLEETKQGSLFVFALNGLIQTAKKQGLDPTIFERWLESRNEKTIEVAEDEDGDEFSLEDLTAAMAPAKDEAKADESEEVEADADAEEAEEDAETETDESDEAEATDAE